MNLLLHVNPVPAYDESVECVVERTSGFTAAVLVSGLLLAPRGRRKMYELIRRTPLLIGCSIFDLAYACFSKEQIESLFSSDDTYNSSSTPDKAAPIYEFPELEHLLSLAMSHPVETPSMSLVDDLDEDFLFDRRGSIIDTVSSTKCDLALNERNDLRLQRLQNGYIQHTRSFLTTVLVD